MKNEAEILGRFAKIKYSLYTGDNIFNLRDELSKLLNMISLDQIYLKSKDRNIHVGYIMKREIPDLYKDEFIEYIHAQTEIVLRKAEMKFIMKAMQEGKLR